MCFRPPVKKDDVQEQIDEVKKDVADIRNMIQKIAARLSLHTV